MAPTLVLFLLPTTPRTQWPAPITTFTIQMYWPSPRLDWANCRSARLFPILLVPILTAKRWSRQYLSTRPCLYQISFRFASMTSRLQSIIISISTHDSQKGKMRPLLSLSLDHLSSFESDRYHLFRYFQKIY